MQYLQPGSCTTGALIGLGVICGPFTSSAAEFMLRPQTMIKQQTAYTVIETDRHTPSLSSQEIVQWLRDEGLPIAIIADIAGVERKSVYAWLGGGVIKLQNQERLEKIYSLLTEGKAATLRHLYRFWSRNVVGEQSLSLLFQEKTLDESLIRSALAKLWPLAKKEALRESSNPSSASITSNPFIRDSREVTISYDT
ncbi:MAG: hypothetical protein JSR46_12315 [Verrucomicrobia bacterium]|nr:hypothetical protein [Verrucomicrobiota bacterium]